MKNIAFIGTSHIHTPNFISKVISNNQINCIGVWDRDKNRSKSDSEKLNCKNYNNYIDLLKEHDSVSYTHLTLPTTVRV